MIEELKKLIDDIDNMSDCFSIKDTDDRFSVDRAEFVDRIKESLGAASRKLKRMALVVEVKSREDLVISRLSDRHCTCSRCDEGRQECAYNILYVCGKDDAELPDKVYSNSDDLLWYRNGVATRNRHFGYGETMIEAQFDYIRKFEGKNASKSN